MSAKLSKDLQELWQAELGEAQATRVCEALEESSSLEPPHGLYASLKSIPAERTSQRRVFPAVPILTSAAAACAVLFLMFSPLSPSAAPLTNTELGEVLSLYYLEDPLSTPLFDSELQALEAIL